MQSETLYRLFLAGFFLILTGMVLVIATTFLFGGTSSFGGIINARAIPIVFGAGPDYFWALILALFITVLSVVLFILLRKKV